MKVLIYFAPVLYKESVVLQKLKKESVSDVLTCSDEAFILLCIIVYFCEYSDSTIKEEYAEEDFVRKTGWQEAGIDLYNRLYKDVQLDRLENGEEFNKNFRSFYDNEIEETGVVEKKRKEKRRLPQAMNDL